MMTIFIFGWTITLRKPISTIKGGVSDFWKPMLIFEITKTNTLLPQKCLAPILIAPPHTYVVYATQATISYVKQSKTNVTPCLHLTWGLQKNTIEVIIISDAVYTGCCAARQIPDRKLLPHSIYDVLTQISNDFQRPLYRVQCRQTLAVAARRVRCRHGVTHLSRRNKATSASDRRPSTPWVLSRAGKMIRYLHGSYFLPYRSADVFLFFIRHLYLSVTRLGCSLNALSSTSWVDTPLTATCFFLVLGPDSVFLKRFWKMTYPTFNSS